MQKKIFESGQPYLVGNQRLRKPQVEFFEAVQNWYGQPAPHAREVSVVLPTGTGKTGCMAIAKYAVEAKRVLIIVPSVNISSQVWGNLDETGLNNFYLKCDILPVDMLPKVVHWTADAVAGLKAMEEARVVVTNIQQLVSKKNGLDRIPPDFFDLILVDESHHNIAQSWKSCRDHFHAAKIINFSATPMRTDGKLMHGEIICVYTIIDAMLNGYCKSLVGHVIHPERMQVTRNNHQQVDELVGHQFEALGQSSAGFRRAVNNEEATVQSIIEASLQIWRKKKIETGEDRLKIIASARNLSHCKRLVEAYEKHGVRAGYLHSDLNKEHNAETLAKIENHELDVVVQIRMIAEGYSHPFFSVAAIFSSFGSLLPFYQFVGRTMRVLRDKEPGHPLNEATIVIHGATNQVELWNELKEIIDAGKDYYNNLVSKVPLSFRDASDIQRRPAGEGDTFQIIAQQNGQAQIDPLVSFKNMLKHLMAQGAKQGMTLNDFADNFEASAAEVFGES